MGGDVAVAPSYQVSASPAVALHAGMAAGSRTQLALRRGRSGDADRCSFSVLLPCECREVVGGRDTRAVAAVPLSQATIGHCFASPCPGSHPMPWSTPRHLPGLEQAPAFSRN